MLNCSAGDVHVSVYSTIRLGSFTHQKNPTYARTCARTLNKTTHSNHFHHWDELTYWRKLLRFKLGSLIGRECGNAVRCITVCRQYCTDWKFYVVLHYNERLQCECVDGAFMQHTLPERRRNDARCDYAKKKIVIVHSVQTNARTRIDQTYLCAVVYPIAFYQ